MLKEKGRILGIDDGPFSRGKDGFAPLVGVLMRLDGLIEGIRIGRLPVDGDLAEQSILEMVMSIGTANINMIMSEGITFAGFDIVDPEAIYRKTGIPYVSITQSPANVDAMETALHKHGDADKVKRLRSLRPVKVALHGTEFTLNLAGVSREEAILIIEKSTFVGNLPEPVRIADMLSEAAYSFREQ